MTQRYMIAYICVFLGFLLCPERVIFAAPKDATPPPGPTLEILSTEPKPDSFHPLQLNNSTSALQLSAFIVERMGHINEERNTLEMPLFETPVAGYSSVRHQLRLKPGLRFSNGEPLTARDIASSYLRLRLASVRPEASTGLRVLARCFFLLEQAEALDARTLELSFSRPVRGEELAPMLANLPLFPDNASDELLLKGQAPTLGPYHIAQSTEQRIELSANAYYPLGKPKIERILLRYVSKSELSGLLSISTAETPQARLFLLPPSLALATQPRLDLQVRVAESRRVLVLGFQQRAGSRFHRNPELRQAIARLIEREALLESVPMPDWLRSPLVGPYVPDRRYEGLMKKLPQLKYDPELARNLLLKQGYVRSGESLRDARGQPLVLSLAVDARVPSGDVLAGVLRDRLTREGIELRSWTPPLVGGADSGPDLVLQEWFMDEDEGYTELLHSNGIFNPLGLRDPPLDKLLELERRSMLLASRERYRREIQTRLVELAAGLWLWQRRDAVVVQMPLGVAFKTAAALDPYYLFRGVHLWQLLTDGPSTAQLPDQVPLSAEPRP